jgi:hypothetical protein
MKKSESYGRVLISLSNGESRWFYLHSFSRDAKHIEVPYILTPIE